MEDSEQTDPIGVTFYLKSGQSFTVQLIKLTRKRNGLGRLVGLEWENASSTPDRPCCDLSYIDVDDVSAIVIMR